MSLGYLGRCENNMLEVFAQSIHSGDVEYSIKMKYLYKFILIE